MNKLMMSHSTTLIGGRVEVSYKRELGEGEIDKVFDLRITGLYQIYYDVKEEFPLIYQTEDDVYCYYLGINFDYDIDLSTLEMKEGESITIRELNLLLIKISSHFCKKDKTSKKIYFNVKK